MTDSGLVHFSNCKQLTELNLYSVPVTDAGLAHFKDCPNLTLLNLTSAQITDAGLANFDNCHNLVWLRLDAPQVTDAGLAHFSNCQNLTSLSLSCPRVSHVGFLPFGECEGLKVLALVGAGITNAELSIFQNCRNVVELHLENSRVTDEAVAIVRQNHPQLGGLYLHSTPVSDACLNELVQLRSLGFLNILETRVSLRGVEQLKGASSIRELQWSETNRNVAECVLRIGGTIEIGIPGEAESRLVQAVGDLPTEFFQVRSVSLASVPKPLDVFASPQVSLFWRNSGGWLAALQYPEFDKLERLDLSGVLGLDLTFLASIHGLNELTLANTAIADLAVIPPLASVKRVILDGNDINVGFTKLEQHTALTELSLADCGLTDDLISQLPKLPLLQRLNLDGNDIRGHVLKQLAEQPALIDLSLGCPSLGDLLAANLAELKQLKRLSLAGSGVGDAGIKHLASLPNLESLDLRRTKATAAGIAELQLALPMCRITSDFSDVAGSEAGK